jgi:hypothetical protein
MPPAVGVVFDVTSAAEPLRRRRVIVTVPS